MSGYCKNCGNTLCVCDMTQDEVNPTLNAFLEQEKRRAISEVLEQVVEASKQRAKMSGQDSVRIDEVIAIVRSFMPPTEGSADDPR